MNSLYKTFKDGFKIFIVYLFSYLLLESSMIARLGVDIPMVGRIGLSALSMLFSTCIVKTEK